MEEAGRDLSPYFFLHASFFNIYNMKITHFLSLFALLSASPIMSQEQDTIPAEPAYTIFDDLAKHEAGKGVVTIHQSEAIRNLVGACKFGKDVETTDDETFLKIQGFRTQVFSGNNQRKSKTKRLIKRKR